jgi:leader peptidase (prepilin peptidase)/N-methyltransferase
MAGMEIALAVVFALLGMVIGSFLNVVIDRLPAGESIVFPPSHCPGCKRHLSAFELIPVFSYIALRGRCRTCGVRIPLRVLLVEIGTGAAFGLLYWNFGHTAELALAAFYFCLFEVLAMIDLEYHILPNVLVYPGMVFALAASLLLPGSGFVPDVLDAVIGGLCGLGIFLVIAIASRGGMGWGDVKMAALIGLAAGYPLVFVAILLAVVSGGLIAGLLIIFKIRSRKETIPFGPFLSLAAVATLVWGQALLDWYLGFLRY